MFSDRASTELREMLPGVRMRTLAFGDNTLMSEFEIDAGAVIPVHDHPHEQTGYLVSGRLQFTIDGEITVVESGDAWNLEGNLPHGATALENCVVVEVFSPVREDYLP
jgi:quercetin dioxygenase-like cupin family protein